MSIKKGFSILGLMIIIVLGLVGCGIGMSLEDKENEISKVYEKDGYEAAQKRAKQIYSKSQTAEMHRAVRGAIQSSIDDIEDEIASLKDIQLQSDPENIIEITEHSTSSKDDRVYIEGYVKNIGDRDIRYYEVLGTINDSNGEVLDSGRTNDGTELRPGDSRSFEIMIKGHKNFQKYSVRVGDISFK